MSGCVDAGKSAVRTTRLKAIGGQETDGSIASPHQHARLGRWSGEQGRGISTPRIKEGEEGSMRWKRWKNGWRGEGEGGENGDEARGKSEVEDEVEVQVSSFPGLVGRSPPRRSVMTRYDTAYGQVPAVRSVLHTGKLIVT